MHITRYYWYYIIYIAILDYLLLSFLLSLVDAVGSLLLLASSTCEAGQAMQYKIIILNVVICILYYYVR